MVYSPDCINAAIVKALADLGYAQMDCSTSHIYFSSLLEAFLSLATSKKVGGLSPMDSDDLYVTLSNSCVQAQRWLIRDIIKQLINKRDEFEKAGAGDNPLASESATGMKLALLTQAFIGS